MGKGGPSLEEQRYRQLRELDDETTLDLFQFWRPSESEEMGGGLAEAARVLLALARREAERKPEQ